jgi:ABC-type dipeptide/oligopeptide/nickel transport system permease subunit
MTRAVMLDVMQEHFINTARAKGVPERLVLLRHTLRNALIPILTICGESFASLVTGTIVIESVFGIPGVGSLIVDSIERRDVTVIQGVVLLITVCYVLVNLAVDLLSYLADPRLSVEGKAADDEQKPRNLDLARAAAGDCAAVVFASAISSYDPYSIDPLSRLKPPSLQHWFGTDNFGRDLFVRVALAVRVSLSVGAAVAVIAGVTGLVIGLLCAWYRPVDRILMRVCDGLFAFPSLLLAIAIVGVLGPKISNVVLALSLVYVPSIARVIRGAAMVIKEKNFIEALRAQGASASRIIWLHLLPNVVSPFIVQVSWVFSVAILTEAALSFLGSGVPRRCPASATCCWRAKR